VHLERHPAWGLVEAFARLPSERPYILEWGGLQPFLVSQLAERAPHWFVLDLRHELWTGTAPELLLERAERLLSDFGAFRKPFDLVLSWNLLDYIPKASLLAFSRKLEPYLSPQACWHTLLSSRPRVPATPTRLELESAENGLWLQWEELEGRATVEPSGWSPGELERTLRGLVLEKSRLLTSGIHELLLVRGERIERGRPLAPRQPTPRPPKPPTVPRPPR
jgi:hypothetical protein